MIGYSVKAEIPLYRRHLWRKGCWQKQRQQIGSKMEFEHYIQQGQQKLRCGYTTGTCAALAGKAAVRMLLGGQKTEEISVLTPKGLWVTTAVEEIQRDDGWVSCGVRKDAGDDIDVTAQSLICVKAKKTAGTKIVIDGGVGVGRVTKPGLEQPVGAAAIITAIFLTGGFGYTARVPEAEEIEYVTVSMPFSFESGMAQNGSILRTVKGTATVLKPYTNCITLSTEKDINTVLSIHKLITNEKKSDEKTNTQFSVKYYFKNGKSMERTFTNISEKDLNSYFAVADTDGVKEQQYLFLAASDTEREKLKSEDVKAPNMSNLQGYFLFRNYGNPLRNKDGVLIASKDGSFCRELSSDELDKLGKCIWSDISKKKYTDILRGSEKEVAYIYLNDNATYYGGRYEENVEGRSVLAAVTDDMTETLKFIKEHGMADALGQKREVKSVNIYDCRRIILQAQEINKSGKYGGTAINPIFIMSTMFNTKEIKLVNKTFGDMDDCFIKSVTNQKQSDELFALAQGQCYTSLGGYIAQITFTDGYNQTMYIPESDAPGYIK